MIVPNNSLTDHAISVVFLLGQKQLFQDCVLGLKTAQFMVALGKYSFSESVRRGRGKMCTLNDTSHSSVFYLRMYVWF